jgi:DNA transformation protein
MFGGHGLYVDDVFVALIARDRLYLKVDADSRDQFAAAGCEPFVYDGRTGAIAMSYWSAPPQAMESPALMDPWARLALRAALAARAGQAVRRKGPGAPTTGRARASGAGPKRRGSR